MSVQPIYMAASMKALNRLAQAKVDQRNPKMLLRTSEKVLKEAESSHLAGDQERAYVMYMRFFTLISVIKKSRDYLSDKKYYESIIGRDSCLKAVERAEKLSQELTKRYDEMEAIEFCKKLDTMEVLEGRKNGVVEGRKGGVVEGRKGGVVDGRKGVVVDGLVEGRKGGVVDGLVEGRKEESRLEQHRKKLKEILYDPSVPSGWISVKSFYKICTRPPLIPSSSSSPSSSPSSPSLSSPSSSSPSHITILLLDVRSSDSFNKSHINITPNLINIPHAVPGSTGKSIELKLSGDFLFRWRKRVEYDVIVMVDEDGGSGESWEGKRNSLICLKSAMVKWDPGVELKSEPLFLKGGMREWTCIYPTILSQLPPEQPTSNPGAPKDAKTLLDELEYALDPSLFEEGHMVRKDEDDDNDEDDDDDDDDDSVDGGDDDLRKSYSSKRGAVPVVDRSVKPVEGVERSSNLLKKVDKGKEEDSIPQQRRTGRTTQQAQQPSLHFVPVIDRALKPTTTTSTTTSTTKSTNKVIKTTTKTIPTRIKTAKSNTYKRLQQKDEEEEEEEDEEDDLALIGDLSKYVKMDGWKGEVKKEVNSAMSAKNGLSNWKALMDEEEEGEEDKGGVDGAYEGVVEGRKDWGEEEYDIRKNKWKEGRTSRQLNNNLYNNQLPPTSPNNNNKKQSPFKQHQPPQPPPPLKQHPSSPLRQPLQPPQPPQPLKQQPSSPLRQPPQPPQPLKQQPPQPPQPLKTPRDHHTTRLQEDSVSSNLKRFHSSPNIAKLQDNYTSNQHQQHQQQQQQHQQQQQQQQQKRINTTPKVNRTIDPLDLFEASPRTFHPIWGTTSPGLTGLRNLGNTCYMNSLVQCLSACKPLRLYFLNNYYKREAGGGGGWGGVGGAIESWGGVRGVGKGRLVVELAVLLKTLWSGQHKAVSPIDFRACMGHLNGMFAGSQHQDAQELFEYLTCALSEQLNRIRRPASGRRGEEAEGKGSRKRSDEVEGDRVWMDMLTLEDSVMVDLFKGQFKSRVMCSACEEMSTVFEPFVSLSLPLPHTTPHCSLADCLLKFSDEEKMTGDSMWFCPRCRGKQVASKRIVIWRLPTVLVVHLKRFHYQGIWRNKISTSVTFPLNDLDMSRYLSGPRNNSNNKNCLYDLFAVCNHFGTLDGGHYTATCKNEGAWFKFDDSDVSKVSSNSVQTSASYILFYIKNSF